MADILIKGLHLSKDWELLSINVRRNGKVSRAFDLTGEQIAEAIINPAIKVVRCKDCKWFNNIGCAIKIVDESDKPREDDFCSFAERKDCEQILDEPDLSRMDGE